jgi:hypothetical protein
VDDLRGILRPAHFRGVDYATQQAGGRQGEKRLKRYNYGELNEIDVATIPPARVPAPVKEKLDEIRGGRSWPKFMEWIAEKLASEAKTT